MFVCNGIRWYQYQQNQLLPDSVSRFGSELAQLNQLLKVGSMLKKKDKLHLVKKILGYANMCVLSLAIH